MEIQHQIRSNANDIRDYISSLYNWEDQIANSNSKNEQTKQMQKDKMHFSKKKLSDNVGNHSGRRQNLVRDNTKLGDYYAEWDNIDVEEEMGKIDSQETDSKRAIQFEHPNMKKSLLNKPKNTRIKINGGRDSTFYRFESKKQQGNEQYIAREYKQAIQIYSELLSELEKNETDFTENKKIYITSLLNRSQCYLNLQNYSETIKDCTLVLSLDKSSMKGYFRRSKAYRKLNNLRAALQDLNKGLQVIPNDKEFLREVKEINKEISYIKQCFISKMDENNGHLNWGKNNSFVKIKVKDARCSNELSGEIQTIVNKEVIDYQNIQKDENDIGENLKDNRSITNSKRTATSEFIKLKSIDNNFIKTKRESEENTLIQPHVAKKVTFNLTTVIQRKHYPNKSIRVKKSSLKQTENSLRQKVHLRGIELIEDRVDEIIEMAVEKQRTLLLANSEKIINYTDFLQAWNTIRSDRTQAFQILKAIGINNLAKIFQKGIDSEIFKEIIQTLL